MVFEGVKARRHAERKEMNDALVALSKTTKSISRPSKPLQKMTTMNMTSSPTIIDLLTRAEFTARENIHAATLSELGVNLEAQLAGKEELSRRDALFFSLTLLLVMSPTPCLIPSMLQNCNITDQKTARLFKKWGNPPNFTSAPFHRRDLTSELPLTLRRKPPFGMS